MFYNLFLLFVLSSLLSTSTVHAQIRRPKPKVPWVKDAVFEYSEGLSDEFKGLSLNENIWDPNGLSNPDTGCPKWNGPPSTPNPEWATYFPGVTDPITKRPTVRQYRVRSGRIEIFLSKQPLNFFTSREYYCNSTTFKCNHDSSIDCFSTDFFGKPLFSKTDPTKFRGVIHDKCKKEPFCIPHPEYVTKKERVYSTWAGAHLVSRKQFKYGFVESRVRLGRTSSALSAVWMHNDELVDGWCRYKKQGENGRRLECPALVRSRRWQEIDLVEAMNTQIHKRRYVPNVHLFTGYKGEFTSRTAKDNGDGSMGGGPIVIDPAIYRQGVPSFSDVDTSNKIANDWHYNPGSVFELDNDWASQSRVLGVYWSPHEIRFYVDGKEVRRLKNEHIHQPMHLDLSLAWNVQWGQEIPSNREQQRKFRVRYLRHWQVFTKDGIDPPSDLPLDDAMIRKFDDRYGSELLGVHGQFPANDGLTIEQTLPDPDDSIVRMSKLNESLSDWTIAGSGSSSQDYYMQDIDEERKSLGSIVSRMNGFGRRPFRFKRAGGRGNRRFSKRRRKLSKREKRVALGRPDREAFVSPGGGIAGFVQNSEITAFEFSNPNKIAAGWSTVKGLGRGDLA